MDRSSTYVTYQFGVDSLNSIVLLTLYVSIHIACHSAFTGHLSLQWSHFHGVRSCHCCTFIHMAKWKLLIMESTRQLFIVQKIRFPCQLRI